MITEEFPSWYGEFDAEDPGYQPTLDDTALQLYSSGTTGLPKGVELTHRNLMASMVDAMPLAIGYHGPPDVMLNALPTYHIAGVGVALLTASKGGMSVLYPDFDPAKVVAAIAEHRITHSFLVPAMIQFMLQVPGADKADYSSLKGISYGASPISEKVLIDAMRTFKCHFVQVYGLTETTGAITCLPPEDHDPEGPKKQLLRSAGKPIDGVELRVADAAGRDCAEGEVGEVWIRTAQNMKGYWANPKATGDAFVDRQAGGPGLVPLRRRRLPAGGLPLPARPHQGHDRLRRREHLPGRSRKRADAASGGRRRRRDRRAGRAMGRGGEGLRGAQSRAPGATQGEIIDFMRDRIAHFKCPKSVDFVDAIPRNPTGKILKRVLREPYWKGRTRRVN